MAKEDKNKKGAEAPVTTEITVDNIREKLGKGTIGSQEMSDAVLAEINKEKNEKTQKEMKRRYQEARYQVISGLIKLRHERDVHDIQHDELTQRDRLARYLMGFKFDCSDVKFRHASKLKDTMFEKEEIDFDKKTVEIVMMDGKKKTFKDGETVPPIINYVEYDELKKKIGEETRKKMSEADKMYTTDRKNLDAEFGEYYECSWRY